MRFLRRRSSLPFLLLLSFFLLNSSYGADSRPIIKIGVSSFLTGDDAFMGESYQHALQLAQADRKNGKYQYQLIFEDCQASPTKAVLAVQKFINVDHVQAIISMCDAFGNVTKPIAAKAGLIHFCYGTTGSM